MRSRYVRPPTGYPIPCSRIYGSPFVAPGRTKDNAKTWVYDGVIFWLKRSWIFNWFDEIDKIVIYDKSFRRAKR